MSDVEINAALVDGTWTVRTLVTALTARRKSLGLHQSDVARIIGCGQQLVSRWETGDNEPDLAQLASYARAVGLELRIDLVVATPVAQMEDM
jgi:transcriptional regulator with XRE-family HTH domain